MRVGSLWPPLALCLVAVAARGEEPAEQVRAPQPAQRVWAEKLASGLGLRLARFEVVKQPGREERKIESVDGWHLDYLDVGLYVNRFRFASAAEAKAYLEGFFSPGSVHQGRICPADPRWVTEVQTCTGVEGNRWTEADHPALFERVDAAWPAGEAPPKDLGERIGAGAPRFAPRQEQRGITVDAVPAWEGLRAELAGLLVERRACADATVAEEIFGSHVEGAEVRKVCDLRGSEVVILAGGFADDPLAAARALELAWSNGDAAATRVAVGTLAARPASDAPDEMAVFTLHPGGRVYQAGANLLATARSVEGDQKLEGEIRWKFLDPGVRNHVMVRTKDTLWSEARVTPASMLAVVGRSEPGWKREKEYLLALMAALKLELPPPSSSFVELVGQGR